MFYFGRHALLRFIFAIFVLSWNLHAVADETVQPLAGAFKDCPDCPDMVPVPAGKFNMGSPETEQDRNANESPLHSVNIAQPFAVGKYEVTFDEWDACVAGGGCPKVGDGGWGRGKRPVINVNWTEAQTYASWLTGKTGKHYRLLTEAEWEYAARAGTASRYFWGNDVGQGKANCKSCGSQWDGKQTAPVGSFQPNAFGLYDMMCNVWEWVQDWYGMDYYSQSPDKDPTGPVTGQKRVLRGGSWTYTAVGVRAAYRFENDPTFSSPEVGIRCARTTLP